MEQRWQDLYKALARAIWLGAGIFLLLFLLDATISAVMFALLTLVLAVTLNAPVTWLEKRRYPRPLALSLVLTIALMVVAILVLLVIPPTIEQGTAFVEDFPKYANQVEERTADFLTDNPALREQIETNQQALRESVATVVRGFVTKLGRYTVSFVGLVIGILLLATTVVYAVASPKPLLKGFLGLFPPALRDRAARAFSRGSQTVVGWVWANVIIGGIEAIAAAIFLTLIGVPAAIVWAVLTFFAELVPKIGSYLMAIPPFLVALAVDPMDALWVLVFYIVVQWVAGDLLGPFVRAQQMRLHAVSVIIVTVGMGAAFGLLGALLATPLLGYVKAFYDEFYPRSADPNGLDESQIEGMMEMSL